MNSKATKQITATLEKKIKELQDNYQGDRLYQLLEKEPKFAILVKPGTASAPAADSPSLRNEIDKLNSQVEITKVQSDKINSNRSNVDSSNNNKDKITIIEPNQEKIIVPISDVNDSSPKNSSR